MEKALKRAEVGMWVNSLLITLHLLYELDLVTESVFSCKQDCKMPKSNEK